MTCYVLFTQNTKMGMVTVVPTEMWAFALPVWAYVLVARGLLYYGLLFYTVGWDHVK